MKTIYLVNVLEIWIGLLMELVRLYGNVQRRGTHAGLISHQKPR